MASNIINVNPNLPAYTFRVDLDDQVFSLSFRYNARMARWIMDILTENNEPLKMGVPVQTAVRLLEKNRPSNFPAGEFLAVHETGLFIDPERDEFGTIVKLFYMDGLS